MRRLVFAALVLALGFAVLRPGTALGHAALAAADPGPNAFLQRAPTRVALTFSEPVDEQRSAIQVLDAAGAPVGTSALDLSANQLTAQVSFSKQLEPGIYNVLWANVSRIDGHALRGSYPFTVLNPDGSVPDTTNTVAGIATTDPAAARWRGCPRTSLLGLVIQLPARCFFSMPTTADPPRGFERTILLAPVSSARAPEPVIRDVYSGTPLSDLMFQTRTGGYWLTRLGAAAAIAAAVAFVGDNRRLAAAGMLVAGGVYLWAYSSTSHAAASSGSNWAILFDLVHGLAAVLWVGAVVGLALTARLAGKNVRYRSSCRASAGRFLAGVCAARVGHAQRLR
jgi:copper transport protein